MPICKYCAKPFAWGNAEGKWVPLVPAGEEGDLDRTYQDEHGQLRAGHRAACVIAGGESVRVARLAKSIPAADVLPQPVVPPAADPETGEIAPPKKRRKRKSWAVEAGLGLGPQFDKR
jgi:hypothetical protein